MVRTTRGLTNILDDQSAFIFLPVSLVENVLPEDSHGVFFNYYEQPVFFPLDNGTPSHTLVGSAVIGATVSNRNISNLTEGVTISARLSNKVHLYNCVISITLMSTRSVLRHTELHKHSMCELGFQCSK